MAVAEPAFGEMVTCTVRSAGSRCRAGVSANLAALLFGALKLHLSPLHKGPLTQSLKWHSQHAAGDGGMLHPCYLFSIISTMTGSQAAPPDLDLGLHFEPQMAGALGS